MSCSAGKRKRVVVSMQQRLDAIKRINRGESLKAIALDFGVGESTVSDWKKKQNEIETFCGQLTSKKGLESRLTLKKPHFENLDEALLLWFNQEREKGTPISGPILKEKALLLYKKIGGDQDFTASEGWLTRWKKRHGIYQLSISGEKLSADPEGVKIFQTELKEMIAEESLTAEQLYNVDETGLYYRMLPSKTLASKIEATAPGYKKNKDRVTLSLCSNSTGTHKLPIMLIGKSRKPRAFKNINMAALPVHYRAHKSAWMNTFLFKEWFKSQFVPSVEKHLESKGLPLKAVLLLDNAPSHPNKEELKVRNIKAVFFPPNVTSLVQPMDQGVIETLKRRYRRKFLGALQNEDSNVSLIDSIKAINIKDVMYMVASAWSEIPSLTLAKSWRKLMAPTQEEINRSELSEMIDEMPSTELNVSSFVKTFETLQGCKDITEADVDEWFKSDNDLGVETLSDEDIIETIMDASHDVAEDSDDTDSPGDLRVSHTDGMHALEVALRYVEQQSTSTPIDVMLIKKWRDYAARNRYQHLRQKKVTDFFKEK